ncbi:MAG TPA: hypothetical protein VM369_01720 [Candidatus Binatia bacterium]|nr:hypothetical protein [Candidatus Binatia bacterium]
MKKRVVFYGAAVLVAGVAGGCVTRPFQPASLVEAPPAGQALVNFHRPANGGGFLWDGPRYLGFLANDSLLQVATVPGEHFYVLRIAATGWMHTYVIHANVAAGGVYDVVLTTTGFGFATDFHFGPVRAGDVELRAKLEHWQRNEDPVALSPEWVSRNARWLDEERAAIEGVIIDLRAGKPRKVDFTEMLAGDRRGAR